MKGESERQQLTLDDLGFHPVGVMEQAQGAYVEVRPGESFPASVTGEIDGKTVVLARVAIAARARFEPLGTPPQVIAPAPPISPKPTSN
ncbi:MAG: hypothetical protein HYW63_01630 [Candidatus Levybacteria bacterium]|nr:hypothetical protein [Candidatus Levybacteria bacterium]